MSCKERSQYKDASGVDVQIKERYCEGEGVVGCLEDIASSRVIGRSATSKGAKTLSSVITM